jgi:cytochrome b561
MHTPAAETRPDGLGGAAKQVAEHASALARLEIELATMELKRKVVALAAGIAFGVVALVLLLFALGFALAGGAAAIATTLSTWAAILIVAGGLFLGALFLALFAVGALKKGTPPVPRQAIDEARATTEALKTDGAR